MAKSKSKAVVAVPKVPEVAREFQSTARALEDESPPRAAILLLLALAAFFIGAIVWAWIARVDEVVPVRGSLVSSISVVVVQPLELSVVRSIEVEVGEVVHKDDVLALLDPTFAEADSTQLEDRLDALNAREARLQAELDDRTYLPSAHPSAAERLEASLFSQRRSNLIDRLRSFDEDLASVTTKRETTEIDLKTASARLDLLQQTVDMRQTLNNMQLGTRLALLEAQALQLTARREQDQLTGSIGDLEHQAESIIAQRNAFQHDWREQALEEMARVRQERDGVVQDLGKAKLRQEKTSLIAPIDSIVLDIGKRSAGSVAQAGETLFTLVPLDAPLEAEVQIKPNDIGEINVGDDARIKVDAFPFQKYGTLKGTIRTISADVFAAKANSESDGAAAVEVPFYRARIALDDTELPNKPAGFRLLPGMTLTADVHLGERQVLSYLLYPVLKGLSEAVREP